MTYEEIHRSCLKQDCVTTLSLFSLKWKKAILGKLKNIDSLLSFQIKVVEKKAKKRITKCRVSLSAEKITFLIEFPASSLSAESVCILMVQILWVRSNSAGCTCVILGWFCVLHPETPSTIIPVYTYFSWWWRNFKSFCIADVQNNYVLPWTLVLQKISDSHFFPPLTKIWKYKLWGFLPAAFQMFWLGTCKVIKVWQFAFLSILHWHLGYS